MEVSSIQISFRLVLVWEFARRTWERAHALRPADAQVRRNLAVFR
jgi:hypothetical protein